VPIEMHPQSTPRISIAAYTINNQNDRLKMDYLFQVVPIRALGEKSLNQQFRQAMTSQAKASDDAELAALANLGSSWRSSHVPD
jgi:hypothetical protein